MNFFIPMQTSLITSRRPSVSPMYSSMSFVFRLHLFECHHVLSSSGKHYCRRTSHIFTMRLATTLFDAHAPFKPL